MLVRRYIHQRLQQYYATSPSHHHPHPHWHHQQQQHLPPLQDAAAAAVVVGSLSSGDKGGPSTIPYAWLLGEGHWRFVYGQLYRATSGQWLTPSELFAPHYSRVVANYIAQRYYREQQPQPPPPPSDRTTTKTTTARGGAAAADHQRRRRPLEIVELGGGRGTNAVHILNHLARTAPDIYERCSYRLVDASPPLLALQRQAFSLDRTTTSTSTSTSSSTSTSAEPPPPPPPHAGKVCCERVDLHAVAEGTQSLFAADRRGHATPGGDDDDPITVVLALEVLDNLPHDKIRRRQPYDGRLEQCELVVAPAAAGHQENAPNQYYGDEVYAPVTDPLLARVLQRYPVPPLPHSTTASAAVWIPTTACGVLDAIYRARPTATVLVADFDALPRGGSDIGGGIVLSPPPSLGEPLVTDLHDVDHPSYRSVTSTPTDILFPTDFARLAAYCRGSAASTTTATVQKQAEFLRRHGPGEVKATTSWLTEYSPMVDDFANCSVLTVTATRK